MTALAELTTLQVGGPAERLVTAATRDELVEVVREVWSSGEDWLLLGGGSNLVVADEGVAGTVVRIASRGIERRPGAVDAPRSVRLRIEAGEPWDELVRRTVDEGWSGIEALSGIPGSVGAAPVQNIGAYGQELAESLEGIVFLDFETGEILEIPAGDLGLGYRTSSLKRGRLGVVLAVDLALSANEGPGAALAEPVAYRQLADTLGVAVGTRVPLADLRAAVLELRAAKGMLLDPADSDSRSAGSFFTNPIVSENFARGLPADGPRWPVEPERPPIALPLGADVPELARPVSGEFRVKLSAAWLIERAGIGRGFALPGSGVAISSKHTLAIVNRGGATALEVAQLASYVQTRVASEFGIVLQPEPMLVGLSL